jgi:hypothetical protein
MVIRDNVRSIQQILPLYTIVLQLAGILKLFFKRPSKPNFKLEPYRPLFNVRFYCNDGRFYYLVAECQAQKMARKVALQNGPGIMEWRILKWGNKVSDDFRGVLNHFRLPQLPYQCLVHHN